MRMTKRAARRGESGFALLLVFAMAAAVALMLYMEMPRVAFEAQRNREQMLIERGEQYKRAIQLYFRKLKTYPPSIDALENTNNVRFLRRRYPDPLTGKDDWRLIHIGPGGIFADSLTNKPKGDKKEENHNNFITEGAALGSTAPDPQASAMLRRRPSEGGQAQPGSDTGGAPIAGLPPGSDQPPVDPGSQTQPGGQPVAPTPGQLPGAPQLPVSAFPGIPGTPFNPGAQQPGVTSPDSSAQGSSAGSPNPFGQPGGDPNQTGANQAADLINSLLRGPRRTPSSPPSGPAGGTQITTGSIAGVASKVEKHGIKIYNEREMYNEWEFIYDFSKDRTGAGRLTGQLGAGDPRLAQGQSGQQLTNTPGFGGQSGLGSSQPGDPVSQPQPPAPPGLQPGPLPPPSTPPQ